MESAERAGRSGEACTDKQQQWNRGTITNIGPKRLSQVMFKRHKNTEEKVGANPCNEVPIVTSSPKYLTYDEFVQATRASSVAALSLIPGSMLHKALTATPSGDRGSTCEEHGDHSNNSCAKCTMFYNTYIDIDRDNLERMTRQQTESSAWHDCRRVRITASSAKKVPVRSTTDCTRFLREQIFPSFRGNSATQHGVQNEPVALLQLSGMGYNIQKSGAVLAEQEPWLSASPDGKCCDSIVEIKCPCVDDVLEELGKGRVVSDLHLVNGKSVLKRNGPNGYYTQVQVTMYCTGIKKCKFFVWTEKSHALVDIAFDTDFVSNLLQRLRVFYFAHMLPRLVDDFEAGRLIFSAPYKQLL